MNRLSHSISVAAVLPALSNEPMQEEEHHELAQWVWPLVQASLTNQKMETLNELETAIGAQRYASGLGQVWRMAQEGRGATLLIEEDFCYPARLDPNGLDLIPADDPTAPDVIDDAVDELIETVLAKGGRVIFVDNGALAIHQRVALILRY